MEKGIIIKNFRALVVKNNTILGARGYKILKYDLKTNELSFFASVKDKKYSMLSIFFLTRRFFRAEVTNLYSLKDGSDILIAKKGLYKREKDSNSFIKCFSIPRGTRPLNLCVIPNGNIFFGEYFSNFEKKSVHIYSSEDNGVTWNIKYTFVNGSINHIHGLFYDKFTQHIWAVTGDRENECIIGYSPDEFVTFIEVFRGGQEYRTCNLLFYENYIVYATDSQYMQNTIKKIDRKTLVVTTLKEIEGSGIYATMNDDIALISTTIEPSNVNKDKYSHLYISKNGILWDKIVSYRKDIWHLSAFQFGSIQFPRYELNHYKNILVFSGRALKKIGGKTVILRKSL